MTMEPIQVRVVDEPNQRVVTAVWPFGPAGVVTTMAGSLEATQDEFVAAMRPQAEAMIARAANAPKPISYSE